MDWGWIPDHTDTIINLSALVWGWSHQPAITVWPADTRLRPEMEREGEDGCRNWGSRSSSAEETEAEAVTQSITSHPDARVLSVNIFLLAD